MMEDIQTAAYFPSEILLIISMILAQVFVAFTPKKERAKIIIKKEDQKNLR